MANTTKNYNDDERDELRRQVWSLWCRGVKNKAAIGRQLNLSQPTVRSYIEYMKQQTTERIARGDEMAEVLSGYQETISAAWQLSSKTKNDNAKIGALRVVQDGLKAIAGMFGVSTANIKITGSMEVEHSGGIDIDIPEDSIANVLHILAEAGAFDPGTEADGEAGDE